MKEAKLKYLPVNFEVVDIGDYVTCAVTGEKIPLTHLRYWSVELQEAYINAEASTKRYRETHERL